MKQWIDRLSGKTKLLILLAILILITNPELLALVATIQYIGAEIFFVLLALQTKASLDAVYVASSVLVTRSVLCVFAFARFSKLAVGGLFPNEEFRLMCNHSSMSVLFSLHALQHNLAWHRFNNAFPTRAA